MAVEFRKGIPLFSPQATEILNQVEAVLWDQARKEDVNNRDRRDDLHVEESGPERSEEGARCQACCVGLSSREEQLVHYRLDWHRCNLKRRLKKQAPLTEEEFECLADDLSSISGSGSDSEHEAEPVRESSPLLRFVTEQGSAYAIYNLQAVQQVEKEALLEVTQSFDTCIILLLSGGHFAGAVFNGSSVLLHKTFHRYTVRAKRGTAQSACDAQQGGHHPRSAGASLRRHNEAALEHDIQDLMKSWLKQITDCSLVFLHTPKHRKSLFVGGKGAAFGKGDPRVKHIPFATRRPTFKEAAVMKRKEVAVGCAGTSGVPKSKEEGKGQVAEGSVEGVGEARKGQEAHKRLDAGERRVERREERGEMKVEREEEREEEKETPSVWLDLAGLCREGNVDKVKSVLDAAGHCSLEGSGPTQDARLINAISAGTTLLHVASQSGSAGAVDVLLRYGGDPTLRDGRGRTAYLLAQCRPVRDAFRRFMAQFPDAWDYKAALIPSPLSEAMEKDRQAKAAEKKAAYKQAKRQRLKKAKQQVSAEELGTEQLSEREKRARAAERRIALNEQSLGRFCFCCQRNLAGLIPFEKFEHKFCSLDCIRKQYN